MNKKTKVLAGGLAAVLGVALLTGAGCASKSGAAPTASSSNEDKCVEIMAYTTWIFQLTQKGDMVALAALEKETGGDLNKRFGWSSYEEMQKACLPVSQKPGFMQFVAKRMQALGFVAK